MKFAVLDLFNAIVQKDILWVPVLLLLMTQVLKISLAHADVVSSTVKEVMMTVGTELCVLAISLHFAVVASPESGFYKANFGNRVVLAGVMGLGVYMILTLGSFLSLRYATRVLKDPIGDATRKWEYAKRIAKFAGLEGLSIVLGLMSLSLVVLTI
ncbi:MAG: hypothetical protein M3348_13225 [Acidobacteriota bacterium]|nr:hypothetical protein [Acidobacteriota bacterium]